MTKAIFVMLSLITMFFLLQPKANYPKFYDGGEYTKVVNTLLYPVADAPFCYRILTPAITKYMPFGYDVNFQIVNTITLFLFGLLLYRYTGSLLSILIFAIPYHTPLRLIFYYPVLIDGIFYLSVMIALVMLRGRTNVMLYALLSFLAVLNREIAIIIPVMLFAKQRSYIPILAGLAAFGLTRYLGTSTGDYNFVNAIVESMQKNNAGHYLNALFYGLTPLILFADFKLKNYEKLYLLFIIIMSLIGGANTVRFIFWASPVFIPCIVRGLRQYDPEIQTTLIVISAALITFPYNTWAGWHIQINQPNYHQLFINFVIIDVFWLSKQFLRKKEKKWELKNFTAQCGQ